MSKLSIIFALTATLICGVSAYLVPENPQIWRLSAGFAALGYGIYFFQERSFFGKTLSRKTAKYGLNAVLTSVIAVGILIFVNLIATKYDIKRDFTKNKLHTLSDESIKVLKGLALETKLKAFIHPNQREEFNRIFEKYTYYTPKLKKEFVDVDKDPLAAQKYNIKQAGTVVIENEVRTSRIENLFGPDDPKLEEKITNAIIQVTKGDKKKIYFVSGHGEKLISETGKDGYSEIKEQLESGRYKVEELILVEKGSVPEDANIVVLAAPKSDLLEPELKALESYLLRGGKLMVLVEPTSTPTLKVFLAKYGVEFNPKKTVVELNPLQQLAGGNPLTPIVTSYSKDSEITREAKQISLFPVATPIEKLEKAPQEYKVVSLFSTSAKSFESLLKDNQVTPNPKTDRKGPLSLSVSITGKAVGNREPIKAPADKKGEDQKEPEFRMIIVGDSDFASNSGRRFGINSDLFQNMLSWMAHEEDLISIRPRPADTSQFEITETRMRVINLASVVFIPLLMFGTGFGVWVNRRRK